MPFQSKNTINNTLIFYRLIRVFYFFGRGEPFPIHCEDCILQLKCLCKIFTKFAANHARARARCSSSFFIVTWSLIRRKACPRVQFNGCSSTTNAHSETGQMALRCQNLTLGALIAAARSLC